MTLTLCHAMTHRAIAKCGKPGVFVFVNLRIFGESYFSICSSGVTDKTLHQPALPTMMEGSHHNHVVVMMIVMIDNGDCDDDAGDNGGDGCDAGGDDDDGCGIDFGLMSDDRC